jgi:hypothetical protein
MNQNRGGGVFIAYATDAGSIARDGRGPHSPFTEALLRYMQKPISIDDMFSLVTKEVRLVTKNEQRPYKYASLENIVCLTPACSQAPVQVTTDIVQEVKKSESEELKIALQTKDPDTLETYLKQYPDTNKRADILAMIAKLRRSQFSEWTLFEVGDKHFPHWMQIRTIERFGDRASVKVKELADPSHPLIANGKSLPNTAYMESVNVYDCDAPVMALSEEWFYDKSGGLLFHYKWADPQYLNFSIGTVIQPGTIASSARNIVCHEEIATPLFSKAEIAHKQFKSLASTPTGDGEFLYEALPEISGNADLKHLALIVRFNTDHSVAESFSSDFSIPDPPQFRTEVDEVRVKCDVRQSATTMTEFWNASNELVRIGTIELNQLQYTEFQEFSPLGVVQQALCNNGYAGIGVQVAANEGGGIKVVQVFADSPAAEAGIQIDDVIINVDNQSLSALTLPQIVEKLRGPVNSTVALKVLREGRDQPLEMSVTRRSVKMEAAQ